MKTTVKTRTFATGDTFMHTNGEEIKILKMYPKGHQYASEGSRHYLVDSSDSGEDNWSEYHLIWRIEGSKKLR